jgi:hypothetical protein
VRRPDEPLRLLDVLDDPAAATGARAVQSAHWPDLVLSNGNSHVMRTAPIEEYIEGFAASTEVARVARYAGGPLDDEQRLDPDTLRWLVLLHAPHADVARRLPKPARVRLEALPPFGHLPHTLPHVRMAAWLVQHPATPSELAAMTGSDEESVLRFIAACDVLGLLRPAPEAVLVPEPVKVAPVPLVVEQPIDAEADDGEAPPVAETVAATPEPAAADPAAPGESMSVLERLRATREQNRARVAAAIRGVSGR